MLTLILRFDKFGGQMLEEKLKFENYEKQLLIPFADYVDLMYRYVFNSDLTVYI